MPIACVHDTGAVVNVVYCICFVVFNMKHVRDQTEGVVKFVRNTIQCVTGLNTLLDGYMSFTVGERHQNEE